MNFDGPIDSYLLDSSVWVEFLGGHRRGEALRSRVADLIARDLVVMMGMVRLELLGGARSEREWADIASLLDGLRILPVGDQEWHLAARMNFELRRVGVTVPAGDLLIAAVAIAHDATVLHRDRHFDLIAQHTPLRVESHVAS
jgi:predicted nucleic acid-binding protein